LMLTTALVRLPGDFGLVAGGDRSTTVRSGSLKNFGRTDRSVTPLYPSSSPGQFVEAVERVVHLYPPHLAEPGLAGQLAQRRLGQPERAESLAASGQRCGHAVQDREPVEQRG